MQTLSDRHIEDLAESCVSSMGDIFWDYDERRDAPLGYIEPQSVATQTVKTALFELATTLETNQTYTNALRLALQRNISSSHRRC